MGLLDWLYKTTDTAAYLKDDIYADNTITIPEYGQNATTVGQSQLANNSAGAVGQKLIQNADTFNTQDLSGLYYSSGTTVDVLTPEESDELTKLNDEWTAENKRQKLQKFRELPKELRQLYINQMHLTKAVFEINKHFAEKTERQKELEVKPNPNIFISNGTTWLSGNSVNMSGIVLGDSMEEFFSKSINPFTFATLEELELAHAEACMEEMIDD